jgi:hypothetical protein
LSFWSVVWTTPARLTDRQQVLMMKISLPTEVACILVQPRLKGCETQKHKHDIQPSQIRPVIGYPSASLRESSKLIQDYCRSASCQDSNHVSYHRADVCF